MLNNGGIGLSANQVGLDAQVFIMGTSKEDATMCINPVELQHTEDTTLDTEGCLSFPNYFVKVRRPKEILATSEYSFIAFFIAFTSYFNIFAA